MFCNDDNTTKGGEFIPTAFNWETLEKKKTKKLAKITKKKNSKKQKKEDKARKN